MSVRPIGRHRIERVGEINDLCNVRNFFVVQALRITASVEAFMMIFRSKRNVR